MFCFLCCVLVFCGGVKGSFSWFSEEPESVEVIAGSETILRCAISNYSGLIQWTRDGFALGGTLAAWPRYQIIGDQGNGQYHLKINEVEMSDDAVFECQATEIAKRSRAAKITVLIPPGSPSIDGDGVRVTLTDEKFNFTCRSEGGKPAAEIEWWRDGERVEGAIYSQELLSDGRRFRTVSVLSLRGERALSGSVFTCLSLNPALPHGSQVSVTLSVLYPPTLTLSVHPAKCGEGETVLFSCNGNANPPIQKYTWYKAGVRLGGEGSVLRIVVNFTFFTEPVTCEAENRVGTVNVSTLVEVEFGPRLLTPPSALVSDPGEDVFLTCDWAGNPPPLYTWSRPHSPQVLSNDRSLRLRGVTEADDGVYVSKALVPGFGSSHTHIRLSVTGPPKISSDLTQFGVIGSTSQIQCSTESLPLAHQIVWEWRDGEIVEGATERYRIETEESETSMTSLLFISDTTERDFEFAFKCTAINSLGHTQTLISLIPQETSKMAAVVGVSLAIFGIISLALSLVGLWVFRKRKRARQAITLRKRKYLPESVSNDSETASATGNKVLTAMYSAFKEDFKTDHRSDTLDTRDDTDMKDCTNDYFNVGGSGGEERVDRSLFVVACSRGSDSATYSRGGRLCAVSTSSFNPVSPSDTGSVQARTRATPQPYTVIRDYSARSYQYVRPAWDFCLSPSPALDSPASLLSPHSHDRLQTHV